MYKLHFILATIVELMAKKTLSVFIILYFLPHLYALRLTDPFTKYSQLNLPPGPVGPDSVALNPSNKGPYVGVSDGRILKYNGREFEDFAWISPNRSKALCDGVRNLTMGRTCGRTLGFSFDPQTGDLYVVGAYGGFYRVGPKGGLAKKIASGVNNVPFKFLNGIDFDPYRRVVYFTDTSSKYNFTDVLMGNPLSSKDSTGRLIEYDTRTGKLRVLLDKLHLPTGPAASGDGRYVMYGSFGTHQIFKYYFKGEPQKVLDLPGYPLKIKRSPESGLFWVPVNVVVRQKPLLIHSFGYKFNSTGGVILAKSFAAQYSGVQVNIVQEYRSNLGRRRLYVGSINVAFVGVYES
ncbi:OLC1v1039216C1 [Oldenlandia corymbosa var. corymbosa]|uniref:OLC1v1039216C1 n=1 Tax=Oldenlandia corymbosa var. corymbosa TaxID=529605 RepID=A0AAV1D587_OLDCO|nr:OLC1v1039216C1 [Oldenlandia corymbosa var. corymbosa]